MNPCALGIVTAFLVAFGLVADIAQMLSNGVVHQMGILAIQGYDPGW
jgi:hypothetical protein